MVRMTVPVFEVEKMVSLEFQSMHAYHIIVAPAPKYDEAFS